MVDVQKKENESPASLIRRFTRKLQQSGHLAAARKHQHRKRPKSELSKKKEALWRVEKMKANERLRKLGKIK